MAYNILLVDDSATTRGVMAKTFRLAEVPLNQLFEATNGKEALDILAKQWIDLVFTDINMPVMDGIELINRMGEDGLLKTIPVVLVSIEGSATRIDQLRAKGVSAFIRKPFTPERIRSVLEEIMRPKAHLDRRETLSTVFCQVLERFAFMLGDWVPKGELPAPACKQFLRARVAFTGPISGSLAVAVPQDMGPQIAANVLGIEADEATAIERAEDALKELVNVVCGQALTALAGEKPVFHLDTPRTDRLDEAGWKAVLESADSNGFVVDEHPVLLETVLKESH